VDAGLELDWLRRKFVYRQIGVSETVDLPAEWKKLVVLPRVVDDPPVDSVLQASRFVSPLILLRERSLSDLGRAAVLRVRTEQKLGDRDLKFNLRLVDYAATDLYVRSIELADRPEERVKLAERDSRRFWRLEPGKGRTIAGYIDPLRLCRPEDSTCLALVPFFVLDRAFFA